MKRLEGVARKLLGLLLGCISQCGGNTSSGVHLYARSSILHLNKALFKARYSYKEGGMVLKALYESISVYLCCLLSYF